MLAGDSREAHGEIRRTGSLVGTVEEHDMDRAIADFTTHLRDRNRSPITIARCQEQ